MSAATGFRKQVQPAPRVRMSVREAVAKAGDDWRILARDGNHRLLDDERITFDGLERADMKLMEMGVLPRIGIGDLDAANDRAPVQVDFVYPPIPERHSDYAAYRDPEGRVGRGATPFLAINDLIEQESE